MSKWTDEEERLLHKYIEEYTSVDKLPLAYLSSSVFKDRTPAAIRRKADRLVKAFNDSYDWDNKERRTAFELYIVGESYASIQESLPHISMDELETELKRLRKIYEVQIRTYAEERGLKTTKNISLGQIDLFIKTKDTTSEFIRKGLHSRIKNG